MTKTTILTGRKEIVRFVGRSWQTVHRWILEKGFPARKMNGVWESDTLLIIEWHRRQITQRSKK